MNFRKDMARVNKAIRDRLLTEVLREFLGEEDLVVNTVRTERRVRGLTDEQLGHYVGASDDCQCPVCVKLRAPDSFSTDDLGGRATSGGWVRRMLTLLESSAPDITPTELKESLLVFRILRGRSTTELRDFARGGVFLTHTPAQAEAERRYFEWKAKH